jgi:hypothetical protein
MKTISEALAECMADYPEFIVTTALSLSTTAFVKAIAERDLEAFISQLRLAKKIMK